MIQINNLTKKYGDLTVLENLNTQINDGDVISIIGPSGCGKSTFIRCLNRLETPTDGEIIVDGENICAKGTDLNANRRKVGMVFQSFNLFSHLMIIENVMFGPVNVLKADRQTSFDEAMQLLETVGLKSKAYAYPDELSGGQKQRVAIARTLAMKPEVVLFDEPTSALDPTMVSEVLGVIRRLAADGTTMAIVTHEMNFARDVSNRVFYMDERGIYEQGSPKEIFENPQKEKTKNFIRKIRSVETHIENHDFDMYAFSARTEQFGKNQVLPKKSIYALMLITEEIVGNTLIKSFDDIMLRVSYSELSKELQYEMTYAGEEFNPFDSDKADEMALKMVNSMISGKEFSFNDGVNRLIITI